MIGEQVQNETKPDKVRAGTTAPEPEIQKEDPQAEPAGKDSKKRSSKLRYFLTALLLLAFAAAVGGGGFLLFRHYQADPAFLNKTTLNGERIGGRTPQDVVDDMADRYNTEKIPVTIYEGDDPALEATLKDFGYERDGTAFAELINTSYADQRKDFLTLCKNLLFPYAITAEKAFDLNEETFEQLASSRNFKVERKETADHEIVFDEAQQNYFVQEGSIGNIIDDAKLSELIRTTLEEALEQEELPERIDITVPEEFYTSVEPAGDLEAMQKECDEKNLQLRKEAALAEYESSVITHTFGQETVVLDYNTIKDWLSVDDNVKVTLNEEAVKEYVINLKSKYDTQWKSRTFQTSNGKTITFPGKEGEYGFTIDLDKELAQLVKDIQGKTAVTRDPLYFERNEWGNPYHLARNGVDDLAGTYVEVNLTRQHLWCYKDGALIVESDIVSGDVKAKKETQTGVFPLAFKQSPRTLVGEEAGGSGQYRTDVKYWMAFYDGQGLHDATWRRNFGGQIYQSNGSHGCVNLPYSVAEKIYNNIEEGTAILIYKE